MLNFVTVNWRNYEGRGAEYVNVLFDSIRRNLPDGTEGRFVVFTDDPGAGYREGVETRPLPPGLTGWFNKLWLFSPGLFPSGERIVFFDLDTVITGPLDALAAFDGAFAILRDVYRGGSGLQSSVMSWRAGEQTGIWNTYEKAGFPGVSGGDQKWIEDHCNKAWTVRLQDVLPGMFVSYKVSGGELPAEASVCVFHGRPRPHEIVDGWVPRVWREGGLSHAELKAVCNTAQETLLENVRKAAALPLSWFQPAPPHDRHVAIIGGGPSLVDMVHEIQWRQSVGQDVWVLNNAHVALRGAGIQYDAQVLLDARPEVASFICTADEYLIASQCDPCVLDFLFWRPHKTLFHVNSPGMADLLATETERPAYLVGGGTTVGMNALALAFLRGYRQIHLYGFDSCYRDGQHHAYSQPLNDGEKASEALYQNKTYFCAPWMIGQAQEFMELVPTYAAEGAVVTVHGSGLLPDIGRDMLPGILAAAGAVEETGDTKTVNGLMWPRKDFHCAAVVFDSVTDLDRVYPHCRAFRTAVQAGGNCGVWPLALAGRFGRVHTFEPDPLNFKCLSANTAAAGNVVAHNAALANDHAGVEMDRWGGEENCGAYQVQKGGTIATMRIDDLALQDCDLIYLDIEGFEMEALLGARETIERCRPVIAFEDKGLSERYGVREGAVELALGLKGYAVVERFGRDVIMTYDKKFTQKEYGILVESLDAALAVFQETSDDPEGALRNFVENHYFKVWRAMAPKPDHPAPAAQGE